MRDPRTPLHRRSQDDADIIAGLRRDLKVARITSDRYHDALRDIADNDGNWAADVATAALD